MSSSRGAERGVAQNVGQRSVVAIGSTADIVTARERGRALALALGFTGAHVIEIVTAISELAHNTVEHATSGQLVLDRVEKDGRYGMVIVARDDGPGIPDVGKALSALTAVGQGVCPGLPGVRSLMDDFEICSKLRQGTTVTVRKWLP
jgi:serine/threonine-protein kinase RsbT